MKFSDWFDWYFPLSHIYYHNLKQRKIKTKLVWNFQAKNKIKPQMSECKYVNEYLFLNVNMLWNVSKFVAGMTQLMSRTLRQVGEMDWPSMPWFTDIGKLHMDSVIELFRFLFIKSFDSLPGLIVHACIFSNPLFINSAGLCSKKNSRKPNALSLCNPGCPTYDF